MEAFSKDDRHHKPQSFRPNLFQPTSAPRVSTDPQSSSKASHLQGLHHHRHRHHRHSRHAKDKVQSAVQLHPPTSFGDLLKQVSRSKDSSPSHSRRESLARGDEHDRETKGPQSKKVRPEDIAKEQAKVRAREEALRSSHQALSDQSLNTSRQLDDTYYSILEKLSVLQQTLSSLQELSGLTKDLHESFQSDTSELAEDVQGQFEALNNFQVQEQAINELEDRIKFGKGKADALVVRLTEARRRVEARAQVEAEWETRTNRRLQVLWGILGTVACLMVMAILFRRLKSANATNDLRGLNSGPSDRLLAAPIPEATKDAITELLSMRRTPSMPASSSAPANLADDNRLRIFDEL